MEQLPGSLPEAKPNDNQDKKKKHQKGANLRFAALASLENPEKKKKQPRIEARSLADLALPKPETNDKSVNAKTESKPDSVENGDKPSEAGKQADFVEHIDTKPELSKVETPTDTDKLVESLEAKRALEADEEPEVALSETYEALPKHELEPIEFSGGEVIIHLNGDIPVAERVIPLHDPVESLPKSMAAETPVFGSQKEQQHKAINHESAAEPKPTAPSAAEVGDHVSLASADVLPESPLILAPRPEDIYPAASSAETTPVVASERPATKQEVEDAIYYATKAGQNRGLLTGLLVGGGYEHFKHKRREKRLEKHLKKQSKQLESARNDFMAIQQEQAKKAERSSPVEHLSTPQKRFENPRQTEKLPEHAEVPLMDIEKVEIPEGHRLETSSWHTIEVDSKTGKPVENPVFQYGQEYYRERAQEAAPLLQRNAATGEVALVAAAAASNDSNVSASSGATPHIPDASTQGPPPESKKQKKQSGKDASAAKPSAPAGPLWPWLAALAVVALLLIILL